MYAVTNPDPALESANFSAADHQRGPGDRQKRSSRSSARPATAALGDGNGMIVQRGFPKTAVAGELDRPAR